MYRLFISLILLSWLGSLSVHAQQVMLQGFYWDYPKTGQGYNWSDTLRLKAATLGQAGFSHVWYPPFAGNGNKSGGYDPKDLFIGTSQTSLGTLAQITSMVDSFTANGITPVADMVYNHRDGGRPENNPAVKEYMLNFAGNNDGSCQYGDNGGSQTNTYKQPFPSDRVRMVVPIGASTGLGAGHYYININSHSGGYTGKHFLLYITTNKAGGGSAWDFANGCNATASATSINAPNGTYPASLKQGYWVEMNNNKTEFDLDLQTADFDAAGDSLFIQAVNLCGDYTDHRIWKIWYGPGSYDIADQSNQYHANYKLLFQTYTDFTGLSSKRGGLNWNAFRPNWNAQNVPNVASYFNAAKGGFSFGGANGTCLGPTYSQQSLDYFNDYDHSQSSARDTLIAWTKWAYDRLGSKGLRMDAVKHFDPQFVADMLSSMYNSGRTPNFVVGEWYGENLNELKGWINNVSYDLNQINPAANTAIPIKVFDFSLRRALKDAIDNSANARNVYFTGLRDGAGMSGYNIVTFLNNHDFRSSTQANGDALVYSNPILGYAYLLTNNQLGVPTVFYPDYYGYPARNTTFGSDTYGFDYHPTGLSPLKTDIDRLLKVLKTYINGSTGVSYLNHYGGTGNAPSSPTNFSSGDYNRCLIYQLNGVGAAAGKDVIVAINFDSNPLRVDHSIASQNGIASGTRFLDVLGRSGFPYAQVDGQNRIYLDLPAKSYSVWVRDLAPLSATLVSAPIGGTICPGQSATLTANVTGGTAPYSYSFSVGVTETGSSSVVSASTSGAYSVTVTDALGLTTTASFTVTVSSVSTPTLLSNAPICAGQPLTLTASSGLSSYTFTGASLTLTGSSNTTTINNLASGTYAFAVTTTNADGCTAASSSLSLTINPLPTLTIGTLAGICQGATSFIIPITLPTADATGQNIPDTYSVSGTGVTTVTDGALTGTISVTINPATFTGLFDLTVKRTATGCSTSYTSLSVTVNPLPTTPTLTALGSHTITCGANVTLTASATGANSFTVLGPVGFNQTQATTDFVVGQAGTYTLIAGNTTTGCMAITTTTVDQDTDLPTPTLAASHGGTLTCALTTLTLTASGGVSYTFTGTGISATNAMAGTALVGQAGTFTVLAAGSNGCTSLTTITVASNTVQPSVSIAQISGTLTCSTTAITLTANTSDPTATLIWSTAETTAAISVSTANTYSLTISAANGCTNSASTTIIANQTAPTPSVAGNLTICSGSSTTLTASGGTSYQWTTGDATATVVVSPTATATYNVTLTAATGCSATTAVTVTVSTSPTLVVSPTTSTVAAGQSVSILATGASSYTWSTGETTAQLSASAATQGTVIYSVTGVTNGCSGTASAAVAFTAPCGSFTAIQVTQSGWMCNGIGNITITAVAPGAMSYSVTGPSGTLPMPNGVLMVTQAGSYTVSARNGSCVVAKEMIIAGTNVSPSITNLVAVGSLGNGNCSIKLTATVFGHTFIVTGPKGYVFSHVHRQAGNYSLFSLDVKQPGTYQLNAYLGGCLVQNQLVVGGTACP